MAACTFARCLSQARGGRSRGSGRAHVRLGRRQQRAPPRCFSYPPSRVSLADATTPHGPRFQPAGTFLYVAFMEVIPKEVKDPAHTPLKLAFLLLGFALMSVLAVWA